MLQHICCFFQSKMLLKSNTADFILKVAWKVICHNKDVPSQITISDRFWTTLHQISPKVTRLLLNVGFKKISKLEISQPTPEMMETKENY